MIFKLIYKYFNNEATEEEVAIVFRWIEASEENKNTFITLKKEWIISSNSKFSSELAWESFKKNHLKTFKKKSLRIWQYAAILFIAIALSKTFSVLTESKTSPLKEVVLELSNGKINLIKDKGEKKYLDSNGNIIAEQHNNEIIYHPIESSAKEPIYNTITIPFGKTFKVTLSDASIVHLNAGSTLKYPEQFVSGNTRNVYLTGEAFFEVSKDEKHPFIVHSGQVDVEVLGTKFNLSSYIDDITTHCELVEGSVRMSESTNYKNNTILAPNQKSAWNNDTKKFEIENIDVKLYTAWVYGELMFQNEPFEHVIKKLERSYGVKIKNNNPLLAKQNFTGTIKIKESSVESILDLFKLDTPFEYEINKNSIEIIKPKY
jgi:transmembrane sensor